MSDAPFELDGFEPLSRLGGGGFGDVWLARQVNIDRQVAIKIGHAPIDDKTVQLRFERECIALGRLSGHPNIIDVFTAGQLDDGRPYLVLEFVNGGTLWQRLQRSPLSEVELCRIGIQLSDALGVAHGAGVLHRDLKPENVLLRQNGNAVLGDFGIARLHDGANTTSHAITASVAYAAPEILSGKSASVASDLYGIGICLLASVLRSVPFVHKTDESIHPIINRVLTDKPPDLRQQGVSDRLSSAIGQLLEKDPEKRPGSATAAKSLLEDAASSASVSSSPGPGATVIAPAPPPLATSSGQRPAVANPAPTTGNHPPPPAGRVPGASPPSSPAPPPGGAPPAFPAQRPAPPRSAPGPGGFPAGPAPGGAPPPPGQRRPPTNLAPPGGQPPPPGTGGRAPSGPGAGGQPPSAPRPGTPPPSPQAPGTPPPGGLRPPPQSFTSTPGASGQGQPHPYQAAGRPPTFPPASPGGDKSDRVRVFALAFGATVVIGGLLLFVLTRLAGDDQSSSEVTTVGEDATVDEATSDPAETDDSTDPDDEPDESAAPSTAAPTVSLSPTQPRALELGPLALPLTVADTSFGSDADVSPDLAGPDSSQFCDNVPITVGLSEWDGETITHPQGFPAIFQEVVRFDSAGQAQAFTSSYVATVNCDEWTLPGEDGAPDLDISPEVVDPPPAAHGDENHEITFVGRAEIVDVHARTAIVRLDREVLVLSITSILQNDLTELDSLLDTAVDRLEP